MPRRLTLDRGSDPRARARIAVLASLACSLAAPSPARAGFTDFTVAWGVAAGDSMSYSASFTDFDGDGDLDFYVNNHWKGRANLYRNEAGAGFLDVGNFFGPGNADRHDNLWADLDNDGDPDQYHLHGREQANDLWWNVSPGVWVEDAAAAGVQDLDGRGREIAAADFDRDGWLDIFVANDYRPGYPKPNVLFWNEKDGTFFAQSGSDTIFTPRVHASAVDYDLDGWTDLILTNPPYQAGEIYRNNGNYTFTDVTATALAGLGQPLLHGQGLSWGDYDDDGDLDLFVSSGNRGIWDYIALEADSARFNAGVDLGTEKSFRVTSLGDSLRLSWETGDWQPVKLFYGPGGDSTTVSPLSVALADIAGQPPALALGGRGLYLWKVSGVPNDFVRVKMIAGTGADLIVGGGMRINGGGPIEITSTDLDPPPAYSTADWSNRLLRNEGNGTFSEVTGTALSVNGSDRNSMGATWGDYDNDGHLDLYVSNGGTIVTRNQPNYLYRNQGDGTFTESAAVEKVDGSSRGMSDGAIWGDVNGDGFLDLYVDNGAEHPPFGVGPRQLFLNEPNGNHWLALILRGLGGENGTAIGARVRIRTSAGVQWRSVLGETDNCFGNGPRVHFGLGSVTLIDTLQVYWPSGAQSVFTYVPADKPYVAIPGKPLRNVANPNVVVARAPIDIDMPVGRVWNYEVPLDNYGGKASAFTVAIEDCAGQPINWANLNVSAGAVWPGGTDEAPPILTLNSFGLSPGQYCGRVIFQSSGVTGPDTLALDIQVSDPAVGVSAASGRPDHFALSAPAPNPTARATTLSLALPRAVAVDVTVHDVSGRRVATLLAGVQDAGVRPVRWNGRTTEGAPAAAGIYLIRARAGDDRAVRKVILRD